MARPLKKESLLVHCLRDGSLDCDLFSGEVFSLRRGVPVPRRLRADDDGYLTFTLHREVRDEKLRKQIKPDARGRYREVAHVRVNRLVKIKAMAVAKGGRNWRQFVADLPPGCDVNHIDGNRTNNTADNLELSTELANRTRREMTEEELAELQAAGW